MMRKLLLALSIGVPVLLALALSPMQVASPLCAWCLEEQGETPQETDSHGVCQPHADQMLLNYYWQKLQSVPSYVETQAALFAQEEED